MKTIFDHFIAAQDVHWQTIIAEITQGKKQSHWIWYVFPQIRGLGDSPTDAMYAIQSIEEAIAYYDNDILRGRLNTAVELMLQLKSANLRAILGSPDDVKFVSSMTLFSLATQEPVFQSALDVFNQGKMDDKTLALVNLSKTEESKMCCSHSQVKICMKLEDPKETMRIFQRAAKKSLYRRLIDFLKF